MFSEVSKGKNKQNGKITKIAKSMLRMDFAIGAGLYLKTNIIYSGKNIINIENHKK